MKTLFNARFEDFFRTVRCKNTCQRGYGVAFHCAKSFVHESASLNGSSSSHACLEPLSDNWLWNSEKVCCRTTKLLDILHVYRNVRPSPRVPQQKPSKMQRVEKRILLSQTRALGLSLSPCVNWQDRHYACNITLRDVGATIVAVEKD